MTDNPHPIQQFREAGDTGDSTGDGGTGGSDTGDSGTGGGDAPPVEPREKIPGGGAPVNPRPAGDSSHRGGTLPDDSAPASGEGLDTLAKACKEASSSEGGGAGDDPPSDEASSSQEGGDGDDPGSGGEASPGYEAMRRRRRSKGLTLRLVERMEEAVPESPIPYDSARSCCEVVEQTKDGYLQCTYCKQRWCVVCQRIRMGRAINEYAPILREWRDVHFVSLTVPNVGGDELADEIGDMIRQLGYCRRQIRETRGLELKTLRCIECTYNPDREDFHPHFHVAVNGREQAEALLEEWLNRHPDAVRDAQDVRPWDGTDEGLLELVKYATKLFTPEGGERPDGDRQKEPMDPEALDTIFRALKGRHLLRGTGFDKEEARERAVTEQEIEQEGEVEDFDEEELDRCVLAWKFLGRETIWEWEGGDWWNPETGEALVGCDPPDAGGGSESNT